MLHPQYQLVLGYNVLAVKASGEQPKITSCGSLFIDYIQLTTISFSAVPLTSLVMTSPSFELEQLVRYFELHRTTKNISTGLSLSRHLKLAVLSTFSFVSPPSNTCVVVKRSIRGLVGCAKTIQAVPS